VPKIRLEFERVSITMVMRYAAIAGLAAATFFGAINFGAGDGALVLVDAGNGGLGGNAPVWLFAVVVGAAVYSICREATVSVPPAIEAWAGENKTWLFAGSALLVLAGFALGTGTT
jgi:hypothetical protein